MANNTREDAIDTCLVCGKEVPPGPDFCSIRCEMICATVEVCVDMANRYDEDIEGCDEEELIRYGEGINCCMRLAYFFQRGTMPPIEGDAWSTELATMAKHLSRDEAVQTRYRNLLGRPL